MSNFRRRLLFANSFGSNEPKEYIKFADSEVEKICVKNWSSDGIGLTINDAEKVKSLGGLFTGNNSIIEFEELSYFSGLESVSGFSNCKNLAKIRIPKNVHILGDNAFANDSALCDINIENITEYGMSSMQGTGVTSLNSFIHSIGSSAFNQCKKITEIIISGDINIIPNSCFHSCSSIKKVKLPNCITEIQTYAFVNITIPLLICEAVSPPVLGTRAIDNCSAIYVPDESVSTYKEDQYWSKFANAIHPISEYSEY